MKKSILRLTCAISVLALLACGAYALSNGDTILSLSHLKNVIIPNLVTKGEGAANSKLQAEYDKAMKTLDALQQEKLAQLAGGNAGAYSDTLQPRDFSDGATIQLTTGAGALLLNGTATITHSGGVIDVNTGAELVSGARLTPNHRFLVGEDTLAQIKILSGAAQMGVQGSYSHTAGIEKPTPFYDVSSSDWYYTSVNYVYESQLFSGMDDHHFAPSAAMNRAMLMAVLYRMAGAPEGQLASASASFSDVAPLAWYAPYVSWGATQKITAGTGATTFGPEQQVTRQQVVVLLHSFATNYLGLTMETRADLSLYQDISQASDWAKDALSWAVGEGILSSSSSDSLTLSPQKSANRAEMATMLRVFAEKIR